MRPILLTLALLAGSPVFAGDCPTPKPLTCPQLLAKAEQRHCLPTPQTETAVPCAAVPCAAVPCVPSIVTREVTVPGPERVVTVTNVVVAPPVGHWLLGGGPVYSHGLGVTAVAGYRWPNQWELLIGPTYIPQDSIEGYEIGYKSKCEKGTVFVPPVDAPHPWGAQALVVYAF